jgi:hypothetical protein
MKVYMHYEDNASDNRCMTAPIKVSVSPLQHSHAQFEFGLARHT